MEEAKKRDHRKLGRELKMFAFSREVGQGLPLWLPNGAKLRRTMERYIVDLEERLGYQHVYTPVLANVELVQNIRSLGALQRRYVPENGYGQ